MLLQPAMPIAEASIRNFFVPYSVLVAAYQRVVWVEGLEPPTSGSQDQRSTKLNYTQICIGWGGETRTHDLPRIRRVL